MAKTPFLEALKSRVLLGDGAMGTQLQLAGMKPGECGELWNLERPDEVERIQRRYADAGSDCVITNTFGATASTLKKHGLQGQVKAINAAGARIARRAIGPDKHVLGDIGPCGLILEPFGAATEDEVAALFREQTQGLIEGGVDAIIIETMMALDELLVAIRAVRAIDAQLPVIASMAYNRLPKGGYATMMGVRPAQQAAETLAAGANVVACNCGTEIGAAEHAEIVAEFRAVCDAPIMAQPNAGKPEMTGGRLVYRETPEKMAESVPALIAAGARIVGGCCGTGPEHIARFRAKFDAGGFNR